MSLALLIIIEFKYLKFYGFKYPILEAVLNFSKMTFKTIFIIVVSVLVTIILMNNTEVVNFWIFGNARIPKLAILGTMFGLGLIIGFLAGRPGKKPMVNNYIENEEDDDIEPNTEKRDHLSDEDREYIR